MKFTCNASTIKYTTTRRGVNAVAVIVNDKGQRVATLYDVAERIVAQVDMHLPMDRKTFLYEARQAGHADESENFAIGEFARRIVALAEQKWLNAQGESK